MNNGQGSNQGVVNVIQLGQSEWGMIGGGIAFRQDLETGQLIVAIAMAGGRMSPVAPFQPLQIELRVVGAMPIADVIGKFEAESARVASQAAVLVPTRAS